jgi:O-antigen/teichoic acid export membrane protein
MDASEEEVKKINKKIFYKEIFIEYPVVFLIMFFVFTKLLRVDMSFAGIFCITMYVLLVLRCYWGMRGLSWLLPRDKFKESLKSTSNKKGKDIPQ